MAQRLGFSATRTRLSSRDQYKLASCQEPATDTLHETGRIDRRSAGASDRSGAKRPDTPSGRPARPASAMEAEGHPPRLVEAYQRTRRCDRSRSSLPVSRVTGHATIDLSPILPLDRSRSWSLQLPDLPSAPAGLASSPARLHSCKVKPLLEAFRERHWSFAWPEYISCA